MLATPHLIVGASIVSVEPNLLISLPVAFVSHFILDKIPHWQETLAPYRPTNLTFVRLLVDFSIGFGILWWLILINGKSLNLWVGALMAILPDVDSIFYLKPFRKFTNRPLLRNWFAFHESIQWETDKWWGILTQIVVVLIAILILS